MSTALPARLVLVTHDRPRGVALVTGGAAAERAAVMVAADARWSQSGRGWVVTTGDALNLRGYCQAYGLWLREREARP